MACLLVRNFSVNFVFYYKNKFDYVSSTDRDTDERGVDGERI